MSKLTSAFVPWSRSRSTSPAETCSSAAAETGRAAGIAPDLVPPEVAGHRPATSTAWLAIPFIEAACSSAVLPLPAFAGVAGSAPGTSPSGSDQNASWRLNGMPGIAAAICARSVALPLAAWLGPLTSALIDRVVSGAVTRSCCTASGRACPANTASVAATAAATSVVSAAAASTTQCAVIRRVAIGPRGLIIRTAPRPDRFETERDLDTQDGAHYAYFSANGPRPARVDRQQPRAPIGQRRRRAGAGQRKGLTLPAGQCQAFRRHTHAPVIVTVTAPAGRGPQHRPGAAFRRDRPRAERAGRPACLSTEGNHPCPRNRHHRSPRSSPPSGQRQALTGGSGPRNVSSGRDLFRARRKSGDVSAGRFLCGDPRRLADLDEVAVWVAHVAAELMTPVCRRC